MLDPLANRGERSCGNRASFLGSDAARPLLGLDLLSQYHYKTVSGKVSCTIPSGSHKQIAGLGRQATDAQLRRCMMFGRTAGVMPVTTCSAAIVKMLAAAKLGNSCA